MVDSAMAMGPETPRTEPIPRRAVVRLLAESRENYASETKALTYSRRPGMTPTLAFFT